MAPLKSGKSVRYSRVAIRENINVMAKDEQRRAQKPVVTIGLDKFHNKIMKYCINLKNGERMIFGTGWLQETTDN